MNSEQITAFLQEHWSWVTLIIGAVLLIGAISATPPASRTPTAMAAAPGG